MGLISDYYLDAATLASATKVFLDSGLTVTAPDGYYGADGIYRTVAGGAGVLTAGVVACPDCLPCPVSSVGSLAATGLYSMIFNISGLAGAILIRLTPTDGTPHGILATFGTSFYNAVSSEVDGYHAALTAGRATYLGNSADACFIDLVPNQPYAGVPEYNFYDGAFYATGLQSNVFVETNDLSWSDGVDPGACLMVVPYTGGADTLTVQVSVPVSCAVTARLEVDCPSSLPTFQSSDIGGVCGDETNNTYYHAPVNGSAGFPGLYDWVFEDANGVTPLPNGVYIADNGLNGSSIEVEDGVVISVNACPDIPLLTTYPGAAAAYSVRRLAASATLILRVRRSGLIVGVQNDDEANVAFNSFDELGLDSVVTPDIGPTMTLGEFVGNGTNPDGLDSPADGYVVTWFDQSGNANDATQAADANQPQIVSSGALILENGKPAVQFDGISNKLLSPDLGLLSTDFCIAATCKISASQDTLYSLGYTYPTNGMIYRTQNSGTNTIMFFDGPSETSVSTTLNASSQTLHFLNFNGGSFDVYGNGANKASATSVYALGDDILHIGVNSGNNSYFLSGTLQEFIIYDVEQSSNRTGIETNINTFFSVYP